MELPVTAPDSQKTTYTIETENLSYKIPSSTHNLNWLCCSNQSKEPTFSRLILQDINCEARPRELTAIAGPSGAGKTTLLEILAAKIPPSKVSDGKVLVNNHPIDPKCFRRLSGYVTQDDALFPLLTVEETLMYSALLRLRGGRAGACYRVKQLMKELGLDHIACSRIAGGSNQRISGGEKRRVSIGVELVHDPSVVLIDEPTSGLDSGFRILELLDRVVLLWNGLLLHNGPLNLLGNKLMRAGHEIPRHVNILEFAIDVASSLAVQPSFRKRDNTNVSEEDHHVPIMKKLAAPHSKSRQTKKLLSYPNSRFQEVLILGQRFCRNIFRTNQLFATRIIQAIMAGLILGSIFINSGENNKTSLALQTRLGFFAFTLTFLLSSTTEGLPIFQEKTQKFC